MSSQALAPSARWPKGELRAAPVTRERTRARAPVRKRSASSGAGPRGVELRCELGKLAGVGERCVGPTRELLERFLTRVKKPLD